MPYQYANINSMYNPDFSNEPPHYPNAKTLQFFTHTFQDYTSFTGQFPANLISVNLWPNVLWIEDFLQPNGQDELLFNSQFAYMTNNVAKDGAGNFYFAWNTGRPNDTSYINTDLTKFLSKNLSPDMFSDNGASSFYNCPNHGLPLNMVNGRLNIVSTYSTSIQSRSINFTVVDEDTLELQQTLEQMNIYLLEGRNAMIQQYAILINASAIDFSGYTITGNIQWILDDNSIDYNQFTFCDA